MFNPGLSQMDMMQDKRLAEQRYTVLPESPTAPFHSCYFSTADAERREEVLLRKLAAMEQAALSPHISTSKPLVYCSKRPSSIYSV
jgi:hypothetical protein